MSTSKVSRAMASASAGRTPAKLKLTCPAMILGASVLSLVMNAAAEGRQSPKRPGAAAGASRKAGEVVIEPASVAVSATKKI